MPRNPVALIVALALHSLASAAEPPASNEPRAWYILSQTDTTGLLHGLSQRLVEAVAEAERSPSASGPRGGEVRLTIEYEGPVEGPAIVGFFADPRWALAPPKLVRTYPGPGVHRLERLPPGDYCLGAMVGDVDAFAAASFALPAGCGLGVHEAWPRSITVKSDGTTDVRLRVSNKYQLGLPDSLVTRGTFGVDGPASGPRGVEIHTLDADGKPLPFCRVGLAQLTGDDPNLVEMFYDIGTDRRGVGHCPFTGKFRATIQAEDVLPELLAHRYVVRSFPEVHDASSPTPLTLTAEAFPTGTATVEGRVHNQSGEPLREFYMTLSQQQEFGKFDSRYFSIKAPFIDDNGRYKIQNLPPGPYAVMIRHFDYPTHVYRNGGHAVIVPEEANATVVADFQVEAKELFYGRAEFEDGVPVVKGGWMARFTHDPRSPSGGEYFALGLEPDGRFRVCLSQAERRQVLDNFGGMVDVYATSADNKRTTLKIHLDELSKVREIPTRVVFPGQAP